MELEALFAAAEDEIEKKDKAILELYDALEQDNRKKRKETLKKTENFLKNPDNLITVGFDSNKSRKKSEKGLNSSF